MSRRHTTRTATWTNWAGCETAHPTAVLRPETTGAVRDAVLDAARRGRRLKVVGAGHSFSGLAVTDGVLLSLDRLSGIVAVDGPTADRGAEVAFLAGTRLRDVPGLLRPHGLALANQGDVDPQSLAGAVSTGTHGTGLGFTGFAGMVRRFRTVTPDGTVHDCRPGDPLFDLGRVGLGALGVMTEITLAVVPSFVLSAVERAEPLAPLVESFPERCAAVDHLEYYWFPGTDVAHVKTNTHLPADTPTSPVPRWREIVADEAVNNGVFGALCRVMHHAPGITPAVNRLSARVLAQREFSDHAHDVFVSSRRVRFAEMEYAVPLADAPEVLREVHRVIDGCGEHVGFPVEVRCAGADDVPLSTAHDRDSCYIAVHRYHRDDHRALFRHVEPVLVAAGGRPHWGKIHTLDHEGLLAVHPDLADVAELRGRVDPDGMLRNATVDRIFGL